MIYLESPGVNPAFNLALEQFVFDEMDRSQDYFMLWQNDNAVIVGKNQNTAEEIDSNYVREHNIRVVRRLSGGGAVYHDLGNLNFTFITGAGNVSQMDRHAFNRPIIKALSRLGAEALCNGRNDMTIAGGKFSGSSQYIRGGRILHHGTLLFDSDLSVLSRCLNVSQDKLSSKGIRSVRSRVTNIRPHLKEDLTFLQFREVFLRFLGEEFSFRPYRFTEEELSRVREIQAARYDRPEWNYGPSFGGCLKKEQRLEGCGKIQAVMEVKEGCLSRIAFCGDFFGSASLNDLTNRLQGCPLNGESLLAALSGLDLEPYIHGLKAPQLIRLLLS